MKKNIALVGFMATGKTTVGKALADHLGLAFVDTDELIAQKHGKGIPEIFAQQGEEYFREQEALTIKEVCAGEAQVIATGGGAVLRQQNLDCLQAGAHLICLTASPQVIYERTQQDPSRPLLQNDDRLERIRQLLQARREHYAQAEHTIDTDNWDLPAIISELEKFLLQRGWTGSKT